MVALVTGAGGFLGRYAVEALAATGIDAVGVGRPEVAIPSPAFDALLERSAPELVVHCATPASVPASVERPEKDRQGSVGVLSGLLDRLGALPSQPRLVFIASAAVYGQPAALPVREDHPRRPVSPYGAHRVMCEDLLRERGLPALSLRVFSAYGEGLRRQVLWDICRKTLDEGAVSLSGTGDETRDFVHARDVAAAIVVTARAGDFEGEAYNVGTGTATTIRDLAATLVATLGGDVPVSFSGHARPGDPDRWRADIDRLCALGWQPEVELREGASAYAAWARAQLSARTSVSRPAATT